MNKKVYIKPGLKVVNVKFATHLMAGSTRTGLFTTANMSVSRETNSFEDEEAEEEDTGGWFK